MPPKRSRTGVVLCVSFWLATPARSIELQVFNPSTLSVSRTSQPSWSPTGEYLAYIGDWQPSPYSMSASFLGAANFHGEFLPWLPLLLYGPEPISGISSPTWSPDGKRIAYSHYTCYNCGGPTGIWTVDEFSAPALLRPNGSSCAWSPSGDVIAFLVGDSLWLASVVTRSVRLLKTGIASKPSWSPDGRSLVFSAGNTGLWVLDTATSAFRQLTTHHMDRDPAWSPNGRWIAFSSNRGGHYDLWVMPASGGEAIQLTDDEAWDGEPAWSPNGDRIAFSSSRDHPHLWQGGIWIASQLPDALTEVAPRSWSTLKSSYR